MHLVLSLTGCDAGVFATGVTARDLLVGIPIKVGGAVCRIVAATRVNEFNEASGCMGAKRTNGVGFTPVFSQEFRTP